MMHLIFETHHLPPSRYLALSPGEQAFIRQSTYKTLKDSGRVREGQGNNGYQRTKELLWVGGTTE